MIGKRHHYLPQFLLRRFAARRGDRPDLVWRADLAGERMLQVAPKHEAAKRHYYRTPPELGLPEGFTEDLLGRVESAAAAAIIRFEREKTLDLDERHWLALFLLLQHRRTPAGRRQLTFMDEYVGKLHAELRISNDDAVRSPLAAHGPAPTDEDVERWQAEKLAELERGDLVVESTPEREVALMSVRSKRSHRSLWGSSIGASCSYRRMPRRPYYPILV